MKKRYGIVMAVLCLLACIVNCLGIGYVHSGSAILDLKAELETIYGMEYTGKETENGTQDMVFEVVPKSFFLTNWTLRNTFGMDYKYTCRVIFTNHVDDGEKNIHTITYQAVDPMGKEHAEDRAHLILDSRKEA